MKEQTAGDKRNYIARNRWLLSGLAALSLAACTADKVKASPETTVAVTAPARSLPPLPRATAPRTGTSEATLITMPPHERLRLNMATEKDARQYALGITKIRGDITAIPSVSQPNNVAPNSYAVKFISNGDGSFTRYFVFLQYAPGTPESPNPDTATIDEIFVAKDNTANTVFNPHDTFGTDNSASFMRNGADWKITWRDNRAPASSATTGPLDFGDTAGQVLSDGLLQAQETRVAQVLNQF